MLIAILIFDVLLVAWSLHLMQEAFDTKEFSLMLAGTLVAMSAAAMLVVYFLMGSYVGYLTQMAQYSNSFYWSTGKSCRIGLTRCSDKVIIKKH